MDRATSQQDTRAVTVTHLSILIVPYPSTFTDTLAHSLSLTQDAQQKLLQKNILRRYEKGRRQAITYQKNRNELQTHQNSYTHKFTIVYVIFCSPANL